MNLEQINALYKLYSQVINIVGDEAFDADGNPVAYDLQAVTEQSLKDACKQQAKTLLSQTDWAALPDVDLANKDEFVFYRLNLRNLVRNPVTDPVFLDVPKAIWSNA